MLGLEAGQRAKMSRKVSRLGGRGVELGVGAWSRGRVQVQLRNHGFGNRAGFSGSEPHGTAYELRESD